MLDISTWVSWGMSVSADSTFACTFSALSCQKSFLQCSFFLVSFPEKTSWSSQEVEHFLWTLFLPQQFLLHSTSDPLLLLPNVCQICPLFSMFTTSTFTLAPSTISYLTANIISWCTAYIFAFSNHFAPRPAEYFKMLSLFWFCPIPVSMTYPFILPLFGALTFTYSSHLPRKLIYNSGLILYVTSSAELILIS